jgi:ferredoxin
MIYYFSGTGNSRHIATLLARLTGDTLQAIPDAAPCPPAGTTAVGLVFPVYAWMPPRIVCRFAERLTASIAPGTYLYAVMTCGDDAGKALDVLRRTGFRPHSAFTVIMPNTYVSLPGFNVDKDAVRRSKLAACHARVQAIAAAVSAHHRMTDVHEGFLPRTKTYILGALSARYITLDSRFTANASLCTSCGACARACPTGNISLPGGSPQWNGNCAGCLACYHTCPVHAINFGRATLHKGQYTLQRHLDETAAPQQSNDQ